MIPATGELLHVTHLKRREQRGNLRANRDGPERFCAEAQTQLPMLVVTPCVDAVFIIVRARNKWVSIEDESMETPDQWLRVHAILLPSRLLNESASVFVS